MFVQKMRTNNVDEIDTMLLSTTKHIHLFILPNFLRLSFYETLQNMMNTDRSVRAQTWLTLCLLYLCLMRREVLKQNVRREVVVIVVESGENAFLVNKEGELWCITLKLWKKLTLSFSLSLSLSFPLPLSPHQLILNLSI
jgi:hypothetical protein